MYDELVKRLRHSANFAERGLTTPPSELREAAAAIEELSKQLDDMNEANIALYGAMPRWIPVRERLPDSGTCVLVTDGLEVGEGWITEIINTKGHFSRWCCPTADIDVDWRPITHWMQRAVAAEGGIAWNIFLPQ